MEVRRKRQKVLYHIIPINANVYTEEMVKNTKIELTFYDKYIVWS